MPLPAHRAAAAERGAGRLLIAGAQGGRLAALRPAVQSARPLAMFRCAVTTGTVAVAKSFSCDTSPLAA